MPLNFARVILPGNDRYPFAVVAGISVYQILSAELFCEAAGIGRVASTDVASHCHDRWTDLADTIAAMPEPLEVILLTGSQHESAEKRCDVGITFLAVGRGTSKLAAEEHSQRSAENLWVLLNTTLDYLEFSPISDEHLLLQLAVHLYDPFVTEIRRRCEKLSVSDGVLQRTPVGFDLLKVQASIPKQPEQVGVFVTQLFPWVPSDDSWRRLHEALVNQPERSAVIVHFRGFSQAPEHCLETARKFLVDAEKIFALNVDSHVETVLSLEVGVLREEALRRMAMMEGRLLAARVFLVTSKPPASALIATIAGCLDDASVSRAQQGSEALFRGGSTISVSQPEETLSPLDNPSIDVLFGPREATACVRTAMPTDFEMAGMRINRARTAPITGASGDDVPVGHNIHRGLSVNVAMDEQTRFRHTYIVGQTGTGKSTLLLYMILNDIRRGRGVAVLDPHGTLIEQILAFFPEDRVEDVVIVDVTDIERPVGFNILRITEEDELQYRLTRDLVIDDIQCYFLRTYDPETMGPMFETHFRGMMSILLGTHPQEDPYIPNLLVFRALYTNERLRRALAARIHGQDFVIDDFLTEIESASGEPSIRNMASYVTSKFNRFVSDMALQNITCQNAILDLDDIVNGSKVLLFYLGKGRFGDLAAGLLASQVVSRIRHCAMKRGAGSNVKPFYLYADEFQMFADERFSELLAEARKFKLSLTIAHQYAKQIPEPILQGVLGNVGTTIVFRVGSPDGEMLGPVFEPTFTKRDLISLPNFRAYIRSTGMLGQTPFSVEMTQPPSGGDEKKAMSIRQYSRERYGRPREEVVDEIRRTLAAYKSL